MNSLEKQKKIGLKRLEGRQAKNEETKAELEKKEQLKQKYWICCR